MKTVCGLAVAALALLGGRAEAENRPLAVDLELVLAVDVSYSMEIDEQRSQRTGYVEAFLRPEIVEAIRSGPWGRIAVTYVEWGGTAVQVLPWTLIDGLFTKAVSAEPLCRAATSDRHFRGWPQQRGNPGSRGSKQHRSPGDRHRRSSNHAQSRFGIDPRP